MMALSEWSVDDKKSLQVVGKAACRNLMRAVNRFYNVPSSRSVVRSIHDLYQNRPKEIQALLEDISEKVALTADGWSSRVMRGYFVLSLHSIGFKWKLRSYVLEFRYFPPPHDTWSTLELIYNVLRESNLHTLARAVTTDSGSEMPPVMRITSLRLQREFSVQIGNEWHVRIAFL